MFTPTREFLLVTRAGSSSLHLQWIGNEADRKYDIFVSSYSDGVAELHGSGLFFERRPGAKVQGYGEMLKEHAALLARYRYVALFDDDLSATPDAIGRMFERAAALGVKIAQPSLTWDSYFTYAGLLCAPGLAYRHVTYVEMMCPVFRADVLRHVAPLFELGYESGIGLVWCNLVATGDRDFAVLDDVSVRHTRQIGRLKAANGFVDGRRYEDDIAAVLAEFGLPWVPLVAREGVTRAGRKASVFRLLAAAFAVAAAIPLQSNWRGRARSVAVHIKHALARRGRNRPPMRVPALMASNVA